MVFPEYTRYDGLGLAELVRRKQISPLELIDAALARADLVNPAINAIIHRMDDQARRDALTPGDGPFAGVPFLVKDLVQQIKGVPMRSGSRFFRDFVSDHDTELYARFRRAGLIPIGKTNTPEFGLTPYTEPELFGPTRNPWNLAWTPGGSSGGSAAAVAARIVPLAGGGDGGGSIRIPASCCGLFGLKPSRGRVPSGPDLGELWFGAVVDHVLTRSVRDSAAVLDAVSGPDLGAPSEIVRPASTFLDAAGRDPKGLRIAITSRPFLGGKVHPDCQTALDDAGALLRSLGHHVEEAAPPIDGPAFSRAFLTMICCECATDIAAAARALGRRAVRTAFEPATWAIAMLGRSMSGLELSEALRQFAVVRRQVATFLERYDVLVTPTMALPPFPIGALQPTPGERRMLEWLGRIGSGGLLRAAGLLEQMAPEVFAAIPYTPVFSATGHPAMSVPLYWNAEGLPVGTHVVGRQGDETTLFQLAGQLERARPWADRMPAV